ncbi:MAG: hypothetical protein PF637_01300 [Spirochaetes bacterium]|jgi:hypothetical protein|nr:hypothetical protein [Spirochaetota bacterium]
MFNFRFICVLLSFLFFSVCLYSEPELKPEDVKGHWKLRYNDGFGYEFRLKDNYRAYVALYIKNQLLVFKGVYTIDDSNVLRINISEMKDLPRSTGIENAKGFIKTSSSVFRFAIIEKNEKIMIVEPKEIKIDGRNSAGYFEKRIELKLQK